MFVRAVGGLSWGWTCGALLAAGLVVAPYRAAAADVQLGAGSTEQDLIEALAQAVPGNTVTMAAGTFTLTDALVVPSGVTLRGAGKGVGGTALVYQNTDVTNDRPVIDLRNQANVTLTGFAIDGANDAGGAAWGVVAENGGGHVIDSVAVRDLAGPGFGPIGVYLFGGSSGTSVTNSHFTNIGVDNAFGSGIRLLGDTDNVLIADNIIDGTGRGGIFAKGNNEGELGTSKLDGLVVRGNTVTNSALALPLGDPSAADLGIELQFDIRDAVVEDNDVDLRVSVDGGQRVAVRGNTVNQAGNTDKIVAAFGLEIVNSEDVVLSGNEVLGDDAGPGSVAFGVSISGDGDTRYVLLEDNLIEDATTFGVQVQGRDDPNAGGVAERILLANNVIRDTKGATNGEGDGVRFNRAFDDITLDGNVFDEGPDGRFDLAAVDPPTTGEPFVTLSGNTRLDGQPLETDGPAGVAVYETLNPPLDRELLTFALGEEVFVAFNDLSGQTLDRVLWDLGVGAPVVTPGGALPGGVAAGLSLGQELLAVGWSAGGDADTVLVRIVPEPSAALALLGGAGLTLSRRSSRRSRPSPSSP